MRPSDVTPRILSEQQNGQFLYDVMVGPTSNAIKSLAPAGAFQDIRQFFALPDAVDNSKWGGGLDWYADKNEHFNLVTAVTITNATLVNRKLTPKTDLATLDDLVKPQFKGKIAIYDPTAPNNGSFALAYLIKNRGEQFARQVLDNSVQIESSPDVTNFVQSGRYAIGLGSDPQEFAKLQTQGRANDLELSDMLRFASASGIAVFKNAPDPNAAKVLVNWFLSQEGQQAYAKLGKTNSRRLNVTSYLGEAPGYAEPDWNNLGEMLRPNESVGIEFVDRATQIAKEARR
jgi:iron(III) transport system substrate-binding protein